jgi:DNA-binding beta-propeller fold protein YncE
MRCKVIFLSLFLVFWGCDDEVVSSVTDCAGIVEGNSVLDECGECGGDGSACSSKLYIALQGMGDQVAVLNADDLSIYELVDINFSDISMQMEMPHYIIIDELNGYWFLTTMGASSIGMFSSSTNEMIGAPLTLTDSPALFEIDASTKTLYVSRMPNVDLTGGGMMMGSNSFLIDKINYDSDGMILSQSYDTGHSSPHAISINEPANKIVTASLTHDYISKIDILGDSVESVSLDASINDSPSVEMNRLKPLEIVQRNGFAFITCMGGYSSTTDEDLKGQVQMWDVDSMTMLSKVEFETNSNPWHIAHHPNQDILYVALSGYQDGSLGESNVVKLSYQNNELSVDTQSNQSGLTLLHGIEMSDDGQFVFVSSRSGGIYKFSSNNLELLASTNFTNMQAPGGIAFKRASN